MWPCTVYACHIRQLMLRMSSLCLRAAGGRQGYNNPPGGAIGPELVRPLSAATCNGPGSCHNQVSLHHTVRESAQAVAKRLQSRLAD